MGSGVGWREREREREREKGPSGPWWVAVGSVR